MGRCDFDLGGGFLYSFSQILSMKPYISATFCLILGRDMLRLEKYLYNVEIGINEEEAIKVYDFFDYNGGAVYADFFGEAV